jgi:hypothetical protein
MLHTDDITRIATASPADYAFRIEVGVWPATSTI